MYVVFLRKCADQWAIVTIHLAEMMDDRLLTVQQDFDVENHQGKFQLAG